MRQNKNQGCKNNLGAAKDQAEDNGCSSDRNSVNTHYIATHPNTIGSQAEGEHFIIKAMCQAWHFSKCQFVDLAAVLPT